MVGLGEQGVEVDPARAQRLLEPGGQPAAVVVDHRHAKAQRAAARDGLPDAAHAKDAQRAAVDLGAGEEVV